MPREAVHRSVDPVRREGCAEAEESRCGLSDGVGVITVRSRSDSAQAALVTNSKMIAGAFSKNHTADEKGEGHERLICNGIPSTTRGGRRHDDGGHQ